MDSKLEISLLVETQVFQVLISQMSFNSGAAMILSINVKKVYVYKKTFSQCCIQFIFSEQKSQHLQSVSYNRNN